MIINFHTNVNDLNLISREAHDPLPGSAPDYFEFIIRFKLQKYYFLVIKFSLVGASHMTSYAELYSLLKRIFFLIIEHFFFCAPQRERCRHFLFYIVLQIQVSFKHFIILDKN